MRKIVALYIEPFDDHTAIQIGLMHNNIDINNNLKIYTCADGKDRLLIEIGSAILFTCMVNYLDMKLNFEVYFGDWDTSKIHCLGFVAEMHEPNSASKPLHQGFTPDPKASLVPTVPIRKVRISRMCGAKVVLDPSLTMPNHVVRRNRV